MEARCAGSRFSKWFRKLAFAAGESRNWESGVWDIDKRLLGGGYVISRTSKAPRTRMRRKRNSSLAARAEQRAESVMDPEAGSDSKRESSNASRIVTFR